MKTTLLKSTLLALIATMLPTAVRAEVSSLKLPDSTEPLGWNQMAWGTYSYTDPANWYNGVINDIIGTNYVAKYSPALTFDTDYTFQNGLYFTNSSKGEGTFTFQSDGNGTRTLTFLGDALLSPANWKSKIQFGKAASPSDIVIDLGGEERTFATIGNGNVQTIFSAPLVNGSVHLLGSGATIFQQANPTQGVDATINGGSYGPMTVKVDNSIAGSTGGRHLNDVTFTYGELKFNASKTGDTVETLGSIDLVQDCGRMGVITLIPNANYHQQVTASSIDTTEKALLIRGENLGLEPAAGGSNLLLENPPLLSHASGEGTSLPIALGMTGCTNQTGGLNGSYNISLLTYDSTLGFRPLDLDTDFATAIPDGEETALNVRQLRTSPSCISAPTTINSLIFEEFQAEEALYLTNNVEQTGSLKITSGMLIFGYNRLSSTYLTVPIDFGTARGYISYPYDKSGANLNSTVAGSNGIVFNSYNLIIDKSPALNIRNPAPCSYTGDTYINGRVTMWNGNFLPYGDRTGDVYVNTYLGIHDSTMNGVFGTGTIEPAQSASSWITVGDNDANSDFTGIFNCGNRKLTVNKIGNGTMRFAGSTNRVCALNVKAGTVILDGDFAPSAGYTEETATVVVADGATLAGCGYILSNGDSNGNLALSLQDGATLSAVSSNADSNDGVMNIDGNLAFEGSATLNVDFTASGAASLVDVNGSVLGADALVTVNFPEQKEGMHLILRSVTGEALEPTFLAGDNAGKLILSDDGSALYSLQTTGTCIIFR